MFCISLACHCGSGPEMSSQDQLPNIVLISIDTLRPDHLGCYGGLPEVSPNIDRFSQDSVVFTQAIAHAPSTLPSHASIFTSLIPQHHGASHTQNVPLSQEALTLTEVLAAAGYLTVAVVGGGQLDRAFGLSQGFQVYDQVDGSFREVVELGLRRLDEPGDRPFFLFLHTYEVHHPYSPDQNRLEALDRGYNGPLPDEISIDLLKSINRSQVQIDDRDLLHIKRAYDAEIQSMDEAFGDLVAQLRTLGLYETALVVFTSDHGEEFAEHGMVGWHSHTLYEELLRVPLIFKFPRQKASTTTIHSVARGIDIAPTLLDVAAIEKPGAFDGRSLLTDLRSDHPLDLPVVLLRDTTLKDTVETGGLRIGKWKLAEGRVFDLERDPGELADLASSRAQVADDLKTQLEKIIARRQPMVSEKLHLDEKTREDLRALGYLE